MARRRKGEAISGWVCLDKPPGLGSTTAVSRVRRAFGAQKAGHAGTLDPLARGVLPIALGEATKTVPFLMDAGKTYRFAIAWGEETTTFDTEGEVVARSDVRPTPAQAEAALGAFIGEIEQTPPAFSAVKVDGERAYDLARDGRPPQLAPRPVRIDALRVLGARAGDGLRQGRLCPRPRPRSRRRPGRRGPRQLARAPARRPLHDGAGDRAGTARRSVS
jgi:tRNA pseudouridine55 synthase